MRLVFAILAGALAIAGVVQLFIGTRTGSTVIVNNGLLLLLLAVSCAPAKPLRVEAVFEAPGVGDTQVIGPARQDPSS